MWTLQPNSASCLTIIVSFVEQFAVEPRFDLVCFDSLRIMTSGKNIAANERYFAQFRTMSHNGRLSFLKSLRLLAIH